MSMYELSARLGHNSIQMTVDLYSHLVPEAHFRGAEHAARALGEVPELNENLGDVLPVDPANDGAYARLA
jgi:hypothetical protein